MFEILPASSARADAAASHALLSTAVHGALIGAAILLTARAAAAPATHPAMDPVVYIALPDPSRPADGPPPGLYSVPILPGRILDPLPVPNIDPSSFSTPTSLPGVRTVLGLPGAPGAGADPTGLGGPVPGGAWLSAQVDDPVEVLVPGRPRYPAVLEQAGVAGDVVVEFVVDTAGRVELATLRVVASSHAGFEAPAIEAVLATRFRPARARGTPVRQLARQRVGFVARTQSQ